MKHDAKKYRKISRVAMGLSVFLCVGLLTAVGLVRGAENAFTKYTVSYAAGSYGSYSDSVFNGTAVPATLTAKSGTTSLTVDSSGCITLPATFADTVTISGYHKKLDAETFYFTGNDTWAYSFTGWKVVSATKKIAGETVLQPGFVISPEVLEAYASDGSLELEALWGKCYFIQNPYENMVYEAVMYHYPLRTKSETASSAVWKSVEVTALNMSQSTGATGAYDTNTVINGVFTDMADNPGNDPNAPLASMEWLYKQLQADGHPYDASAIAVMLTGDLDYIQDKDAGYGRSNFISNYYTGSSIEADCLSVTGVPWIGTTNSVERERHLPPADTNGFVDRYFYDKSDIYRYVTLQNRDFGSGQNSNAARAAAVTFKSLGNEVYTLCYKPFDAQCNIRGSMRFDNVKLDVLTDQNPSNVTASTAMSFQGETLGYICHLENSGRSGFTTETADGTHYFELTNRLRYSEYASKNEAYFPFSYLRTYACEDVVICGGHVNSLNIDWSGISNSTIAALDRSWYIGGNAVCGTIYPGSSDSNASESLTFDCQITITGGSVTTLYGGSQSGNSSATGNRTYRIYGDETHMPTLENLYGGCASSKLIGNVDLRMRNCSAKNVYGGGKDYTATVLGNINVQLEGCTISKNVHGGGQYGSCLDNPNTAGVSEGTVTLVLSHGSTVNGTVYGSGLGNVNTVTEENFVSGFANQPADWNTPPTGFPIMNEDGSVTSSIYRNTSWSAGKQNTLEGVLWVVSTTRYFFSMAEVENTNITITDSNINTVYGGGSTAVVNGNTSITINGSSTVSGDVYGGGDGRTSAQAITLYAPASAASYTAPQVTLNDRGIPVLVTTTQTPARGVSLGSFSWSSDEALIAGKTLGDADYGIDRTNRKIYYDPQQSGKVVGNTTVNIADTATVTGNVYGGGRNGDVGNSTTVNITGGVLSESVYGGGYSGKVGSGGTNVNITAPQFAGKQIYGGGYAGAVNSVARTSITGTTFPNVSKDAGGYIYGGGCEGTVSSVLLTLNNVNIIRPEATWATSDNNTDGAVYGGGYAGAVSGNVSVTITNSRIDANVYGGGYSANVGGDIQLTATDLMMSTGYDLSMDKPEYFLYGGGSAGAVGGDITITVTNGQFDGFYGGGEGATASAANVTVTMSASNTRKPVVDATNQPEAPAYQPYLSGMFRGGGREGPVTGSVNVTFNEGYYAKNTHIGGFDSVTGSTNTVINGGSFCNVYGGGDAGTVTGNCALTVNNVTAIGDIYGGGDAASSLAGSTTVTINDADLSTGHYVYGGANAGTVRGTCNVTVENATRIYSVYGGGNQPSSRVGGTLVKINDADVTITRDVYGGSNQGWVMANGTSSTRLVADSSGKNFTEETVDPVTFTGSGRSRVEFYAGKVLRAFGGSNGEAANDQGGETEKFGNNTGNGQLRIDGGEVGYAFGGNNASGTIAASYLTVAGGTVEYAWGGNNTGGTTMETTLTVRGTGVVSKTAWGGNNNGGTVDGTARAYLRESGTVTSIYGGNNNSGVINGGAVVEVTGGTANYVFGGSSNGGTISGGAAVNMSAGSASYIFGGNSSGGVINGGSSICMTGGTVERVFGGCNIAGTINGVMQTHLSGGTVSISTYGGGNRASVLENTATEIRLILDGTVYGPDALVYGGGLSADCEVPVYITVSGNARIGNLHGGGNSGACKDVQTEITGGTMARVYGAGDAEESTVENATVLISGGSVTDYLCGGGNLGYVSGDITITMTDGSVAQYITGGGNRGNVGGSTHVTVSGGQVPIVYGGGNSIASSDAVVSGNTVVEITGGAVDSVYGGGNKLRGIVEGNTSVILSGNADISANVFGGGNEGPVEGNTNVSISGNANIEDDVYGGGEFGRVEGQAFVTMDGGNLLGSLYGGGREGSVPKTKVEILDTANITGSVFGGGKGTAATVSDSTDVLVDMNVSFDVTEVPITTTHITPSGQAYSQLLLHPLMEQGRIGGNVYGGGDLARVGDGVINVGGNKASISNIGTTSVTVKNGLIAGSVFGGGCGIPESGNYNFYMGAVFGSTSTVINGGLIGGSADGGSVYGGGEQSRVYTVDGKGTACTVSVVEVADSKIAINGSIFGGGDRGDGDTSNASVPTVYGNVSVLIRGIKDQAPSNIYFLAGIEGNVTSGGGVYGDGNLCLVQGHRQIKLLDFEPSNTEGGIVKTFYSLQRADEAIMDNSAVVLLGAPDLVEEGDMGQYSINRIGKLTMQNGSVVKLDQVVKYLGSISSDVDTSRLFIHDGTNGRTEYYADQTSCNYPTDSTCLDPLTEAEITSYRGRTSAEKNVVCVANGLYLEVKDESGVYGPVSGLFTLQLLFANPGEGGGFVYGSIAESTGDFICETKNWDFQVKSGVTASNFDTLMEENGGLFIRVAGKAFQRPTAYAEDQTYYTRTSLDAYMPIIDDVGGKQSGSGSYTYYYWYISGSSITFDVDLIGYIGSGDTAFLTDTTLPQHEHARNYVLYGVSVNDALAQALSEGRYELVQSDTPVDQQIAVEVQLGGQSLGFLAQENSVWGLRKGNSFLPGYGGNVNNVAGQVLYTGTVDNTNDRMTWVFHKASTVNTTATDLEVYLDIDLYEGELGNTLTDITTLSYTANISIARFSASQSLYHDNLRSYVGVATSSRIHITGNSCFTAEYQTRYVPAAYPASGGSMIWALTTRGNTYYMAPNGAYFTVDASGAMYNFSDGLSESDLQSGENNTYHLKSNPAVIFSPEGSFSANPIPKNTKITLVDLSDSTPTYYYYICTADTDYIPLTSFKQMGTHAFIGEAAFMELYASEVMELRTERLLFVFDFEQTDKTAQSAFSGGVHLSHLYEGADIMDYVRQNAAGDYERSAPKSISYQFHDGMTGVAASTYTAAFQESSYDNQGIAVLRVHVQEDDDWINTIFRKNGFALKVQLLNESKQPVPMPVGMNITYKGNRYTPGPDSTYIAVPVYGFGDHELAVHNPQFDLSNAVGGNTANFRISYYSAPDAGYHNAFNTGVVKDASYTLTSGTSASLKVIGAATEDRILTPGESLQFTYTARDGQDRPSVDATVWKKDAGEYVQVDWNSVFVDAPQSLSAATNAACDWTLGNDVPTGTYRVIFTYGDCTEYMNLIVK